MKAAFKQNMVLTLPFVFPLDFHKAKPGSLIKRLDITGFLMTCRGQWHGQVVDNAWVRAKHGGTVFLKTALSN